MNISRVITIFLAFSLALASLLIVWLKMELNLIVSIVLSVFGSYVSVIVASLIGERLVRVFENNDLNSKS